MASEVPANVAALVAADHFPGDREDVVFLFLDMMLVALLQRAETGHPAGCAEVHLVQALDQVVEFLVLGHRVAAFGLAIGFGNQLAVEGQFFGSGVRADVIVERLPKLAALSGIALGRGQLLQQVPVFVMVGFQRVINRHGSRSCDCLGMQRLSMPSVPRIRAA